MHIMYTENNINMEMYKNVEYIILLYDAWMQQFMFVSLFFIYFEINDFCSYIHFTSIQKTRSSNILAILNFTAREHRYYANVINISLQSVFLYFRSFEVPLLSILLTIRRNAERFAQIDIESRS